LKYALQYDSSDNVITLLSKTEAGEQVEVPGKLAAFALTETVPIGHKVASEDIEEGSYIVKMGQPVALASKKIPKGGHVHTHNVTDLINNWRQHHQQEYKVTGVTELPESYRLDPPPKLYGYKRTNGVGFRNHLAVFSTVICANQPVEKIGKMYDDVIAMPNNTGCVILTHESEQVRNILLSLAMNTNVGACIFVGLGCEDHEAQRMSEQLKGVKPVAFVRIQDEGGTTGAFEKLKALVETMRADLQKQEREEVPLSSLSIGTKCGGSDWTSSCVSNPTVGYASDLLVKAGGTSFLGETQGWLGGQGMLLKRARTQEVADKIMALLNRVYDKALSVGKRIEDGNPSVGNKAGGITTLNEKALGNVKKSGTAPIDGALDMAERPAKKGLYVLDNPSLDPISLLGLAAAGANVLLFTTGRGTPVGNPLAPVIKISGSPETCRTFSDHIDMDLSSVVDGKMDIPEAGKLLFDELIAVANGKESRAEVYGHREFSMPLIMGTL
jgi:altronate dehydratase large subunit